MKYLRIGPRGAERPVALSASGVAYDISGLIDDITSLTISGGLDVLTRRIRDDQDALPLVDLPSERIGAPIADVGKVVCVGLNYREHARETGQAIPAEPILFLKAPDTIVGPHDDVLIPIGSEQTDYEVELAVVIGKTARYLDEHDDPLDYVAGYAISNDVSERSFQMERGGQWDKGKNCETFNPLGPWLVTPDELGDVQSLTLRSSVNGELRQSSTTADMIFSVAELVRYISRFMVLRPGDVINTGTPQGVGSGFAPPRFVRDGDIVELAVEGLGLQRQSHHAATRRNAPGPVAVRQEIGA